MSGAREEMVEEAGDSVCGNPLNVPAEVWQGRQSVAFVCSASGNFTSQASVRSEFGMAYLG